MEELTTVCSSSAQSAEASKDLQLLWSPELKFSKHETFAWATQKEVQEARPQTTLNPQAFFFFQAAYT